jgi:hypothetical protein
MDGYYGSKAIEAEHAKEVAELRGAISKLEARITELDELADVQASALQDNGNDWAKALEERDDAIRERDQALTQRDEAIQAQKHAEQWAVATNAQLMEQRDKARRRCLEHLSDADKREAAFKLDWRGLYDRDDEQDDD